MITLVVTEQEVDNDPNDPDDRLSVYDHRFVVSVFGAILIIVSVVGVARITVSVGGVTGASSLDDNLFARGTR